MYTLKRLRFCAFVQTDLTLRMCWMAFDLLYICQIHFAICQIHHAKIPKSGSFLSQLRTCHLFFLPNGGALALSFGLLSAVHISDLACILRSLLSLFQGFHNNRISSSKLSGRLLPLQAAENGLLRLTTGSSCLPGTAATNQGCKGHCLSHGWGKGVPCQLLSRCFKHCVIHMAVEARSP